MTVAAPRQTAILTRVSDYAERVVRGDIVAGRYVRLACQRHLDDLALGQLRGLTFDEDEAQAAVTFVEQLRHSKGEWGPQPGRQGKPFQLEDWQVFMVGSVFGWYRSDGTRRFRQAYTEVARKNGKTTLMAAIGLYLAFADAEPGAEVYSAATKRDQAKLCWDEARRMVKATPALSDRIIISSSKSNLARPASNSKFEPLGRDADTADGLNPHGAIIDELHAHTSRDMVDVLETAVGARRNPLIWSITTAGFNQTSIWWEKRQYAISVLEGAVEDDRQFVYLATLDAGDDWRDESVWVKANPNLGVSVYLDDLRAAVRRAERIPSEQNNVRTKRLNQPTEQSERWIDMAQWDACAAEPQIEPGMTCIAGLDLSYTTDLTACVALFAQPDGYYDVICRFWRPEATIAEFEKRDGVPYRLWAEQGYITLTEGDMIDATEIAADIAEWLRPYEVLEIPFDRTNGQSAAVKLQAEDYRVVDMVQSTLTYSEPMHFFEGLLAAGKLRHGGHPILRWNAAQMEIKRGANDAIRPWKPHGSGLRNDGIVALLMALNRTLVYQQQDIEPSIVFLDLSS